MEYNLKIGELSIPVKADVKDDGSLSATVGSNTYLVRSRKISANQLHLEVDGRGTNVYLADNPAGRIINVGGTSYLVRDADDLARDIYRKRGPKEGPQAVTPPMPAVVVRIMVAEGERVKKGQGVVVVMAMKMEATIGAPYPGRVVKINVAKGDKVMPGQILVDIEKEGEEH
ncbi:MAG: biotin/lipoyl-containing protein [Syntrophales bacterium]|nr:biotin/lipoyl-containing protein [Syntrophales bacterium]